MQKKNYYENIEYFVYISTDIGTGCEHCDFRVGLENFAESIDHYIDKHNYKLLHVGTETHHNSEGKPWHSTVALLGK
jgi:hypothetical protein